MQCQDHPNRDVEFFDPILKRPACSLCYATGVSVGHPCVEVEAAFAEHTPNLFHYTENNVKRSHQIQALTESLSQARSVLDLREDETIRKIQQETQRFVEAMKRREQELISLVKTDCSVQREHINATLGKLATSDETLGALRNVFENSEEPSVKRLHSIYQSEAAIGASSFYEVHQGYAYSVSSRPIVADAHLSMTRHAVSLNIPSDLTVALPTDNVTINPSTAADDGLLTYIGTAGGTRPYANPIETGVMNMESTAGVLSGKLDNLFAGPNLSIEDMAIRTKSQINGRLIFDFGEGRKVAIQGYVLRHGHQQEHAALRSWMLVASNDIDSPRWTVLDVRKNDRSLMGPYKSVLFKCNKADPGNFEKDAYRFFALEICGPNAAGENMYHIEISKFEAYGSLYC